MAQEKPSNPYDRNYSGADALAGALVQCESYYRKLWIRCGNEKGGVAIQLGADVCPGHGGAEELRRSCQKDDEGGTAELTSGAEMAPRPWICSPILNLMCITAGLLATSTSNIPAKRTC